MLTAALVMTVGVLAAVGGEEAPVRIAPRSENSSVDLWNTKVGSEGWIKFEVPGNVGDYREAILLLHVDDIDAPEEADLIVNEKLTLKWAKSMIGEGEHGGAIPIDIAALQPARNYFHVIFKSNLGGTTAGFGIKAAELQLFKELSAEQRDRIVLEAASWGKPINWTKEEVTEGLPSPAPQREGPAITDHFQDDPLARWDALAGDWSVTYGIDIFDLEQRDIYRSPEEPSHLAWVGLWKEPGGDVKTCFAQITGNLGLEPSYRPWYGRSGEKRWRAYCDECRMRWGPEDAVATTKAEYPTLVSRDNGDTWENLGAEQEPRGPNLRVVYAADGTRVNQGTANLVCRDGRIVATAGFWEWVKAAGGKGISVTAAVRKHLLGVKESTDNGKTWTKTQWIAPEGSDPALLGETGDETAMVELEDGRIVVIMRTGPQTMGPCQTYLTRVGPGQYEATPPTLTPMPHSGMPELVRGADGVIWYWGLQRHWYSADDGESWHPAPFAFVSYYGKMLEAAPNQILSVTQYLVHDSPYPYWYDGSIRVYRFSWRRSGVLGQNDADRPIALCARDQSESTDLHLRADVRVDGASGLAFRVQEGGKSFYCLAIVLPGSPVYDRWFVPEVQEEVVAANYTGGDTMTVATGEPMLVLARVQDDKVTVLRGMRLTYIPKGSWVRLQVKVQGDLIQGAVNTDPPTYVGARDGALKSGALGLFTDTSTGAFKNVLVWPKAQMIRNLWK